MKRIIQSICLGYGLWFLLHPLVNGAPVALTDAKPVIALQPLGNCSVADIEQAKIGILALYDCEVKVAPAVALPQMAFYKPRSRYRADQLLDFLEMDLTLDFDCVKIVGLTNKDISFTKGDIYDWGIFGLGSLDGKTCVISTYRLGAGKADAALKIQRLIKVINHEIGHTFGMEHCPVNDCLMQDAQGSIKTVDQESGAFCEACRKQLGKVLRVK